MELKTIDPFVKNGLRNTMLQKMQLIAFFCFLFKQPSHGQFGHDCFHKIRLQLRKMHTKHFLNMHVGCIDSDHIAAKKASDDFRNQRKSVATKLRNYSKESVIKY